MARVNRLKKIRIGQLDGGDDCNPQKKKILNNAHLVPQLHNPIDSMDFFFQKYIQEFPKTIANDCSNNKDRIHSNSIRIQMNKFDDLT